jgi:hypothetical protein
MNKDFARKLIEHPGEFTTRQLFERSIEGVFWVDWREADDDIVKMAAKAIGDTDLSAEWVNGKFIINHRGKSTEVPLTPKAGEQGITLATLNKALDPHFEIRFVKASAGGDTLAFMPLRKEHWAALQGIFGAKLEAAFAAVDGSSSFLESEPDQLSAEQLKLINAQMKGVRFARANLRLRTTRFAIEARANPALAGASMPVIEPLFGDLILTYFHALRPTYPVITEAELEQYSMSREELHARALDNASNAWRETRITSKGKIHELTAPDGMGACLALREKLWDEMETFDGPLTAAFPHRDLAIYAATKDQSAIAELRKAVNAMDFSDADALSPNLYDRIKKSWTIR